MRGVRFNMFQNTSSPPFRPEGPCSGSNCSVEASRVVTGSGLTDRRWTCKRDALANRTRTLTKQSPWSPESSTGGPWTATVGMEFFVSSVQASDIRFAHSCRITTIQGCSVDRRKYDGIKKLKKGLRLSLFLFSVRSFCSSKNLLNNDKKFKKL